MAAKFKMTIVIILITSLTNSFIYCQNISGCYLLYEKVNRQTLNQHSKKIQYDTSFEFLDFICSRGSKSLSKEILINGSMAGEIKITGELSKVISQEGKVFESMVLRDSMLNPPRTSDFVLVPLNQGKKVTPFKGQLLWKEGIRSGKILFDQSSIIRTGKTYTQKSCAILPVNSTSLLQCGKVIYRGEEENNLIISETTFTILQILGVSDSIVVANEYPFYLKSGQQVNYRVGYKIKPFPNALFVSQIQSKLIGNWTFKEGHTFGQNSLDSLSCSYDFQFQKNELIVKRNFRGLNFKNTWDTLGYQLNPSADYLILKKMNKATLGSMLIQNVDQGTLVLVIDDIWLTHDGFGNTARKVLIKLKKD